LRQAQRELHPGAQWHEALLTIPEGRPLLLVANEFLDALPVRQFVNGIERRVIAAAGGLAFDRDGDVVEDSPARDAFASEIGAQLNVRGGVAIIIDYGHPKSAPGDTLQAVRGHGYAPVLANPGEADLTAHVDFEALAKGPSVGDVKVTRVVTQGEWLGRLAIDRRAEALAKANPDKAQQVSSALERLTSPNQMGELFKVIAMYSADWPQPAGFE
jgi:SAM-dependent MidA family methyltransferase